MKTRQKVNSHALIALLLVVATVISIFATAFTSFATSYDTLKQYCKSAEFPVTNVDGHDDLIKKQYKRSGGDYYLYTDVSVPTDSSTIINETKYNQLTAGAKQAFLKDFISIAYEWEAYYAEYDGTGGEIITSETVSDLTQELQNISGAGSQMMAALMADVKADYASADRILTPFMPVISTAIGIVCMLMMALLGLTMALDIAYIVIPTFRMMLDGDTDGGGPQGAAKGMAKVISAEAKSAIQTAEGGGGGGGQNGSSNKLAIGQYFKLRWKALLVLGICLLYLVGGHIWSLVAWVIDLVSGFLGT